MADIEKVIKGLECCSNSQKNRCEANSCPYWVSECCCIDDMLNDALELLKEQEDLGKELENAIELIHKKNARIEILNTVLNEQPQIVRCKDCKHCYFASNRIPCEQSLMCAKTGSNITPDWFCAYGEVKE